MKNNHLNHKENHEETEAHSWFSHYMPNLAHRMEEKKIQEWVFYKNILKKALNNNFTNRMLVKVDHQPITAKTYELSWVEKVLGTDPFASFEKNKIDYDIIEAAQQNNVEKMILLIIAGASLYGPKPDFRNSFIFHKNSPLHQAAEKGHVETISFLLGETGIDQNIQNERGMTIFDIAVLHNKTAAASYLYSLDKSALLNAWERLHIKNNQGKTTIDYAHTEQMQNLINLAQLMQDLHIKANEGCFDPFKLFLVSFKNKQEKNQIFNQLEQGIQNAANQKSSKTVNQFIDEFFLDKSKQAILHKHRNLFFKENRSKQTTSEKFIDDIKRKYGNVKLSI